MHAHHLRRLVSALSFAAFLIAAIAMPASAASPRVAKTLAAPHAGPVRAVARVTGAGTAFMTDVKGHSPWWESKGGITLYSDGSAKGSFFCVDLPDSPPGYPGIVWGAVTTWTLDNGLISLHVPTSSAMSWDKPWHWGPNHAFPPAPIVDGGSWRIQIQKFGGAGVGHWTLDVLMNGVWVTFCLEQVVKGKIALKLLSPEGEDD